MNAISYLRRKLSRLFRLVSRLRDSVRGGVIEDEHHYLWDGSSSGWALLHRNAKCPNETPQYGIVNVETKMALLIENAAVDARVKEAMLKHGVRIVSIGDGF